jgi:hypothetical protein
VEPVERAVLLPPHEVLVYDPPGGKLLGQHPPLAAGSRDVQQGVGDLAAVVLGGAAARLRGRDGPAHLDPLAVGQIGLIANLSVHVLTLEHLYIDSL